MRMYLPGENNYCKSVKINYRWAKKVHYKCGKNPIIGSGMSGLHI